MILRTIFCAFIALVALPNCRAQTPATNFEVSPSQSKLLWTGYYLFSFGEHTGTLNIIDGKISLDVQGGISGIVTADMKTIRATDMAYDDGGKDLSEHLMSKDFFDVAQFPKAKIEVTKSEVITDAKPGEPNMKLIANLTIKQVTAPVTLYATVDRSQGGISVIGKFKFDRTRWGIEYNSGKVFAEVGDGAISDAIALEFNIVAESK